VRRGLGWGCMQYKIPVQIENEDPIMLGLSLRQIIIILIGWSIGYAVFTGLAPNTGPEIAALPGLLIAGFFVLVAIFKNHEMTFIPFILALVRYKVNYASRKWQKWDDSFAATDVWFVSQISVKSEKNIDFESKIDKIKNIDDKLDKLK